MSEQARRKRSFSGGSLRFLGSLILVWVVVWVAMFARVPMRSPIRYLAHSSENGLSILLTCSTISNVEKKRECYA